MVAGVLTIAGPALAQTGPAVAKPDPSPFAPGDMKKPIFDTARSAPFHWKARQLDAKVAGMLGLSVAAVNAAQGRWDVWTDPARPSVIDPQAS